MFCRNGSRIVSIASSLSRRSSTSRMLIGLDAVGGSGGRFDVMGERATGSTVIAGAATGVAFMRGHSTMQPEPERRPQLLGIDRLAEIIRRARRNAFLPVALHRLRRDGDDRQFLEFGN